MLLSAHKFFVSLLLVLFVCQHVYLGYMYIYMSLCTIAFKCKKCGCVCHAHCHTLTEPLAFLLNLPCGEGSRPLSVD